MSRHQKRERFSGKSRITDVTISGMAFVKKLNIVFGYMILWKSLNSHCGIKEDFF